MQSRRPQFACDGREEHAVGRQREVVNAGQSPESLDQIRDFLVEQGLAARQSEFCNTQPDGHGSDSLNFFVAQ